MTPSATFPDVPPEPTSQVPQVFNNVECPECGEDAHAIERGGDVTTYVCRSCRFGDRELWKYANYGKKWEEVRQWVLSRDGGECRICGAPEVLHVHHIEKMIWYETTADAHRPDNLVALCEACHRSSEGDLQLYDHINEV